MEGDVTTSTGLRVPNAAIAWRFSRGTGPGGQGVNTTDSRVELLVDLTALDGEAETVERVRTALGDSMRVVVTTERSQLRNREIAISRLIERLEAVSRPVRRRRATRPTRTSVTARLESKKERGDVKVKRRPPGMDE